MTALITQQWLRASVIVLILVGLTPHPILAEDDATLLGRWKLLGDERDSSASRLTTVNRGVRFTSRDRDGKTLSATFDGRSSHLLVKPDRRLNLGTGDFTLALWVNAAETSDDDLGDLLTCFDEKKRIGFNLSLRTNTGVTTTAANVQQLQFGIDSGSEPLWTDEGRPGSATLAFALTVHEGHLYAGTAGNAENEVGRVYRHDGATRWIDCGAPDRSNAISALAVHRGKLYAASSKYRFAGSALPESKNVHLGGAIYRYEGGRRWSEVGRLPGIEAIGGLVSYRDQLYATSLYRPAGFFRYESDGKWSALPVPDGKRVESLGVFNGFFWATSYDGGHVYRWDGSTWHDLGRLGDNTQTYSFAIHQGHLCVGTWPSGKVYRWSDERWSDLGRLGKELEVMGMLVHNGKLYAGTLPLAEVYRYEGGQAWTRLRQLDTTKDVRYRRAWTMAQARGKLFCSTLPSGHVFSMESGPCVTFDRAFPSGWHHVAAVKRGGTLILYLDGKKVAESRRFDPRRFDLTNDQPLLLGAGAGDFFHGSLADVRIYRRALNPAEIAALVTSKSPKP